MNKEDVRVLNDLTESKKRVMTNVVQHLEQREMKKRSWLWQYSVMSIILTVCIGIFIYTQYSGNQEQTASVPTVLDEKFLNLDPQMDDDEKQDEFNSFLSMESLFGYAQSKGIKPTQEQVDKELKENLKNNEQGIVPVNEQDYEKFKELREKSKKENAQKFAELLQSLNLSREEYIERYNRPASYKSATIDLLMKHEKNYYNVIDYSILFLLVERDALNYLEEHYSKEIASLRDKYDIPMKEKKTRSKQGIVVAIEEHEFLVVSGADESNIGKLSIDEITEKHGNGTWFPLIEVPETLSLGDFVEVNFNKYYRYNGDNLNIQLANIDSMKILKQYK